VAPIKIITVDRPSDMKAFIELPWRIYAQDANWIPPLKKEIRRLLDPAVHPFWKFSERILFLAQRDSETVGRIAGIVDHNYNRFHNDKMGIWGFFECARDPEAAAALFSEVEEWARQKGLAFLRGPLNPSTNYEVGLLIEGYEYPPVFLMTYNPPYYVDLVESQGFTKEKDLLAFFVDKKWRPPEWLGRVAKRIKGQGNIRIRSGQLGNLPHEMNLVKEIYQEAWFDNWGFVPMTEAEVGEMARSLVKIIDPDLVFFLYYDEEPVGAGMIVPDVNPLLKRFNGKIGFLGWLKTLLYKKEITGLRGLIFGVKKKYQELGLPLVAFDYLYRILFENIKFKDYQYMELGWNLEDNDRINQWYEDGGAKVYKKYRIFRKSL
jgi:hypothetical protein